MLMVKLLVMRRYETDAFNKYFCSGGSKLEEVWVSYDADEMFSDLAVNWENASLFSSVQFRKARLIVPKTSWGAAKDITFSLGG